MNTKSSASTRMSAQKALRKRICAKIADGQWAPGMALPSLRTLAGEHGISLATAQTVVRDLAAEGVLVPTHGKDIRVAEHAPRHVCYGVRNATVLLIVPALPMADLFRERALAQDVLLSCYSVTHNTDSPAREKRLLQMARSNRLLGVVITPTPIEPINRPLFRVMREEGIKVILTGHYVDEMEGGEMALLPDFRQAARKLTLRLAMDGCRHFCLGRAAEENLPLYRRHEEEGHLEALRDLDLPAADSGLQAAVQRLWRLVFGADRSREEAVSLLATLPERTALICRNRSQADILAKLLHAAGRTVPEDVTVALNPGMYVAHEEVSPYPRMVRDIESFVMTALGWILDTDLPADAERQALFEADYVPPMVPLSSVAPGAVSEPPADAIPEMELPAVSLADLPPAAQG